MLATIVFFLALSVSIAYVEAIITSFINKDNRMYWGPFFVVCILWTLLYYFSHS